MSLFSNELSKAVRLALTLGAATGMIASTAVVAQDDDDKELDTITVIGSRIKRVDVETSAPVLTIEREELERTGLSNIGDVLQNITIADNGVVTTVTSNTNGGDGSINVSLRNLGAERTLVLVNGRRYVGDLDNIVDLQTIPLAIIERVEILKDGASAIYGSDAIAGVVNVVTRESYDGMEASAYVGETEEGDGQVQRYDFTLGASNDRASIVTNIEYTSQDPIFARDREIAREPLFGAGNTFGSGTNVGRFFFPAVAGLPNIPGSLTLIPGRSGRSPADFRPFTTADAFNFAPSNYLQQAYDRYSLFTQGRYDFNDNVSFYTQAVYTKRRGDQQIAEVPITLNASGASGPQFDFGQFSIPTNNVFNPFGRPISNANFRTVPLGPRRNFFDNDTWSFTGGFEGAFEAFDRQFSWDVGGQYQDSKYNTRGTGYVNLFNLRNAVGPSRRNAAGQLECLTTGIPPQVIPGCTPFNFFGGPDLGVAAGVISPEEAARSIDYIRYTLVDFRKVDVTNYTANLTGDIFELPAGPLQFAAGYEYRATDGRFTPDSLVAEGGSSTNASEPTSGTQVVDEYYVELNIPILKDFPFAQSLELNLAGRYSDYTANGLVGVDRAEAPQIGDTTNLKAGFKWKPIDDLLFRGGWAETFRAPTVSDLFGGGAENFPNVNDPCRNALNGAGGTLNNFAGLSPDAQARCIAQGVPAGGYNQLNAQIRSLLGGNPGLAPEFGTSRQLGVVYSPTYLEGFDVSLDWYNIKLNDALTTFGGTTILNNCIRNNIAAFCDPIFIERDSEGNPITLRTAQFNSDVYEVEGWDLGMNYRFDTDFGRFRASWNTTYNSLISFNLDANGEPDDVTGELVGDSANWRYRSVLGLNWALGDFDATWNLRHFSRLEEDCTGLEDLVEGGFSTVEYCDRQFIATEGGTRSINDIGSYTYNDIQVGWNTPWNGRITAGARNVFSKEPPLAQGTFANSFPAGYDSPDSRFWYLSYNQKF